MSEFREDSNNFDANGNGIQIQGHLKADASDEARENALIDELAALIEDTTPDNFGRHIRRTQRYCAAGLSSRWEKIFSAFLRKEFGYPGII